MAGETPVPAAQPDSNDIDAYVRGEMKHDAALDTPVALLAAATQPAAQPPSVPVASAPTQPPAPPAPKFKHPAILTTEALGLGMTKEEIDDTAPAELTEYVRTIHGLTRGQSWNAPAAVGQPGTAAPEPAAAAALPAPAAGKLDWGPNAHLVDEEVRPVFEHILSPLLKEIAELKTHLGHLAGFEQQRQVETKFSRVDRIIAGLGPQFESVYGKGGRHEIDPAGPEMQRRIAALQMAEQIAGANGDFARAFAQVSNTLFGGLASAPSAIAPEPASLPAPRNPDGTFRPRGVAEEWAASTVQRPTNRLGAPEPKGENRAARAISDLAARSGVSVNGEARLEDFPE